MLAGRVDRLHRRGDSESSDARKIFERHQLQVLDSRSRTFDLDLRQSFLEGVDHEANAAVADGVGRDLVIPLEQRIGPTL